MDLYEFGDNEIYVTKMGLGLAALGRPGYINLGHDTDLGENKSAEVMAVQAANMLDYAWGKGVRYFDTARSYGKAELFLGDWLMARNIPEPGVNIGSKWGYTYTADWQVAVPEGIKHEVKEHTVDVLEKQLKESNAALPGHLDLYQIHSATLESGVLDNRPVLDKLAEMRDSGLLIGLSVSGPNQAVVIEKAIDVQFDGKRLFDSVQATWNLLEQSAGPALQAASNAGMGVIIKEAVANGRLTSKNNDPKFMRKMIQLNKVAKMHGVGVDAISLAAVIAQPFVNITLSGAATIDHLSSNLEALDIKWQDDVNELFVGFGETPKAYWGTRSNLAWN
ncbi:MAG: aryl-alcohol dehydrogenase-like predicted oxidoreductase [Cellvibrionaceae bacterium]|jgi:aryl-alcohol dehydrogenase-like predicted oxidoreductase